MNDTVLTVDIGGTKIAAALADRDGTLSPARTVATPATEGPAAVVAAVVALAAALAAEEKVTELAGVGIGAAGVVNATTGTIVSATKTFKDWPGTPLADLVRAGLGTLLRRGGAVAVLNDVDAHALGEVLHGAAAGASSALVVAVGTGVGAGVVIEHRPVLGAHHVGGEIAHMPVPGAAHLTCPCGRPGHLEAIGSGVGLHRHFLSLGGDATLTDARAIVRAAAAGDALAARAISDSATAVGRALAGIATVIDPERIIIGGGVPDIGDAWWEPCISSFRAEVIDALQGTPLLPAAHGNEAALRGAAAAAWSALAELTTAGESTVSADTEALQKDQA